MQSAAKSAAGVSPKAKKSSSVESRSEVLRELGRDALQFHIKFLNCFNKQLTTLFSFIIWKPTEFEEWMCDSDYKSVLHNVSVSDTNEKIQNTW